MRCCASVAVSIAPLARNEPQFACQGLPHFSPSLSPSWQCCPGFGLSWVDSFLCCLWNILPVPRLAMERKGASNSRLYCLTLAMSFVVFSASASVGRLSASECSSTKVCDRASSCTQQLHFVPRTNHLNHLELCCLSFKSARLPAVHPPTGLTVSESLPVISVFTTFFSDLLLILLAMPPSLEVVAQFTDDGLATKDRICDCGKKCRSDTPVIRKGENIYYITSRNPTVPGRFVCEPCYLWYLQQPTTTTRPTASAAMTSGKSAFH